VCNRFLRVNLWDFAGDFAEICENFVDFAGIFACF